MSAYDADPDQVTIRDQSPTFTEIARGPAGDCCILCGKVGINLRDNHGCQPDIDPADLARPRRSWQDLFSGEGGSQ